MPTQVPKWMKFEKFETFDKGPYKDEVCLVYRNVRTGRLVRKPAGWIQTDPDLKFRYFVEQAKAMWREQFKGRR